MGHSLLATQLVSRIREAFELEVPLSEIFTSPTISQLEPRLSQLRMDKNGLSLPTIEPRESGRQLPLSWAQERLWFLNQLERESNTYNMPWTIRVSGHLDMSALEQSLSKVVARHEVLRTSFLTENGIPKQVIKPNANINIERIDLRQQSEAEREIKLSQLLQTEVETPFNLEKAPLIRCSLLQLEDQESVLLLNIHHIIFDGWSMKILTEELSSLYKAFSANKPSPLAPLPIQYADYALWQRENFTEKRLQTQLDYWKRELADAPELLQLPTDRPRPSVQGYGGATKRFSLSSKLTNNLDALSVQYGTTLFMLLQTVLAVLLHRYSGQTDILIGSPIANRNRSEIESLIGFFVNTVVLRNRMEDNPSFEKLLTQVKETTLKAYEHQDVPFERVVELLQPQRSMSHSPLFQVMFSFQSTSMDELELPGVSLSQLDLESTTAKFDLTLSMTETERGLEGAWEYATDLFDDSTIERMATHFENLLEAIVENPAQKVGELPLLSKTERHQLLVEWNNTQSEYAQDKCIHHLFESQVERTPNAVAVVFESQQLTYQQLNQRANQLARYLQSLGVKKEVLVGICIERSIEMVVGLLAILKAGGAYVPLDPNYPAERLSYMLSDSGVELLLTQHSLLETLPEYQGKLVCLDTDWQTIRHLSPLNFDVEVGSDNLAYVIYTSGSTGNPKGVMIEHHSVISFLNSMNSVPGLTSDDIFYSVTTVSFDIVALEIYLPLIVGAKMILASRVAINDSNIMLSELLSSEITVMQATPITWQMMLTCGWSSSYPLKVLCGGEALSTQLVNKILETGSELWNLYGPTETTIWATTNQVTTNSANNIFASIGRPIANTQIYVLDKYLQPVSIGVPGELYIGGDGVARGYLNRPELTSQKFISNPFGEGRIYKTGDKARYLLDGNIEYIGRLDNQVKVRGFRIELGEIESVLSSYAQIQQAIVVANEDSSGSKRLVAYIVTLDKSFSTQKLRQYLKQKTARLHDTFGICDPRKSTFNTEWENK